MSAKIRCPHCNAALNVSDPRPGRRVRCGGCDRMFPIPSDDPDDLEPLDDRLVPGEELASRRKAAVSRNRDEDERPVRRRGRGDEDAPSGGLPTWLIVGGAITGVLMLVVVLGGIGAAFMWSATPVAAPPVAMVAPPAVAVAGGGGGVAGGGGGGVGGGVVAPPAPAGTQLRYRWQGTPAVYAVKVMLENEKDYEVHRGYTTVTARHGPRAAAKAQEKGTGTGFVVHADGYLITCAHVVERATKIEVAIGGKAFPGTVKAVDHEQDLALVHIPTTGLPTVPLADSEAAELGTEVWAVGFPLASVLGESVKITKGTLSGINQKNGPKVFQIDASINPGNSGGPLFTANGAVLGVNKSKLVGEDINNVGFATPTNEVAKMLRGQGVAFANVNAGAKLDGPALIRQVGPAVGLITVTSTPPETFTVGFKTHLSKSTFPLGGGGPANLPTPVFGGTTGEIDADTQGELSGPPRNDVRLPALLGGVGRFLIEPLGSGTEPTWRKASGWVISYNDDGGFPGFPPGFPGRIRPPIMRKGPPFGPPGAGGEPKKQLAVERSTYTRGAVNGDEVTIEKKFELKAEADAAKNIPGLTFTATKTIVFDTKAGLPKSMEFKGVLVESEKNKEFRLPVTATFTLVTGEDAKRVLEVKAPPPPPPPPPAKSLTEAELTAALKDLTGADRGKRSEVVARLKNTKPDTPRRDEVVKALVDACGDPDFVHRRACADALAIWVTAAHVPTLLPLLESTDIHVRGVMIGLMETFKDERAAEPLARRVPDGFDRMKASKALQAIGSKAEKPVAALLTHGDLFTRMEAAKILKVIGTKASKEALEKASNDMNRSVARYAKEALAEIAKR